MFTQCPDCQTTFRVAATVLKQAEGRVRCGGCGNAFNALEHMSEDEDGQASAKPGSPEHKQLLETLDKLAGPEVTLEDTGVEWRVLEDEDGDADGDGSQTPAVHGRQDDIPPPISGAQESLDLPESEPPQSYPSERRYDDNTILPDDFGAEDDLDELPFLVKPDAPKRRASDREATEDTTEFDDAQVDLALGEPDDWVDLLDEVDDEEAPVAEESEAPEEAAPADDEPPGEDMPSDINTQFLLQAEEMGIDTGSHPIVGEEELDDDVAAADEDDDDLAETDIVDPDTELDEDDIEEQAESDDDDAEELESTGEFEEQIAVAEKALTGDGDEDEHDGEAGEEIIHELVELELEDDAATEEKEEETAVAGTTDDIASAIRGGKDVSKLFDEDSPLVETIVMEGELIGDSINEKRRELPKAPSTFDNPGPLDDTYSLSRGKVRGGRRAGDPASYTVMASVVVLVLILLAQVIHQSRQTLATYGAFNHSIGSIYRVLGKPVTPEWDVRGWQFEVTSNSIDEEEDLLTIYSRIANKSGLALPYPLVHISLTDRWEDIIGSRVLEPNEYLAGDLDPRKPVPSGENFTAVITIESPSAEATGFKLTVCYRVAQGRVRCATQDFKN